MVGGSQSLLFCRSLVDSASLLVSRLSELSLSSLLWLHQESGGSVLCHWPRKRKTQTLTRPGVTCVTPCALTQGGEREEEEEEEEVEESLQFSKLTQ